jgi:hypothetical protein
MNINHADVIQKLINQLEKWINEFHLKDFSVIHSINNGYHELRLNGNDYEIIITQFDSDDLKVLIGTRIVEYINDIWVWDDGAGYVPLNKETFSEILQLAILNTYKEYADV